MTPIKRSRRLQAGLAGLSIVSALGAAVGLGLTMHTGSSQAGQGSSTQGSSTQGSSTQGSSTGEENDDSTTSNRSNQSSQSAPVSPPANTAPQATTSGS